MERKRQATTIYLDRQIAKAIKVKAALNDRSVSDLVNDALARRLAEDEAHLRLARERRRGKMRPLEDLLRNMKRDGLL